MYTDLISSKIRLIIEKYYNKIKPRDQTYFFKKAANAFMKSWALTSFTVTAGIWIYKNTLTIIKKKDKWLCISSRFIRHVQKCPPSYLDRTEENVQGAAHSNGRAMTRTQCRAVTLVPIFLSLIEIKGPCESPHSCNGKFSLCLLLLVIWTKREGKEWF